MATSPTEEIRVLESEIVGLEDERRSDPDAGIRVTPGGVAETSERPVQDMLEQFALEAAQLGFPSAENFFKENCTTAAYALFQQAYGFFKRLYPEHPFKDAERFALLTVMNGPDRALYAFDIGDSFWREKRIDPVHDESPYLYTSEVKRLDDAVSDLRDFFYTYVSNRQDPRSYTGEFGNPQRPTEVQLPPPRVGLEREEEEAGQAPQGRVALATAKPSSLPETALRAALEKSGSATASQPQERKRVTIQEPASKTGPMRGFIPISPRPSSVEEERIEEIPRNFDNNKDLTQLIITTVKTVLQDSGFPPREKETGFSPENEKKEFFPDPYGVHLKETTDSVFPAFGKVMRPDCTGSRNLQARRPVPVYSNGGQKLAQALRENHIPRNDPMWGFALGTYEALSEANEKEKQNCL